MLSAKKSKRQQAGSERPDEIVDSEATESVPARLELEDDKPVRD